MNVNIIIVVTKFTDYDNEISSRVPKNTAIPLSKSPDLKKNNNNNYEIRIAIRTASETCIRHTHAVYFVVLSIIRFICYVQENILLSL